MSNFPTAFWKKQPEGIAVAQGINITWETGLFWSRGGNVGEGYVNSPIQMESSFPFVVNVGGEGEEYYASYADDTWPENLNGYLPYYGWYLSGGYDNGGENVLTGFHQSNPWIPLGNVSAGINNGDWLSGISLWNEADHYTAGLIDPEKYAGPIGRQTYNAFVQSGSATGTFSVSAAQATQGTTGVSLYTTVSGLGEDFPTGPAPEYNIVGFYLDSTKIGEGVGPQDGINVTETDYDQQQIKLYAGSDTTHSNLLNPDPNDAELGAPRGYPGENVEQTTRTKYCTTDGQHTFVNAALSEGDHKIKIYASTIDGVYNSGAFVGFEFELT